MMRIYLFVLALAVAGEVYADSDFKTKADEVKIETKTGVYYLNGNVETKIRGKIFKANKVTIQMQKNKPKTIIAEGNVSYTDNTANIRSDKCQSDMNKVVFLNNVLIRLKEYGTLKAETIVYDLKTKKTNIYSKKRVKLILDQQLEHKAKKHEVKSTKHNKIL